MKKKIFTKVVFIALLLPLGGCPIGAIDNTELKPQAVVVTPAN